MKCSRKNCPNEGYAQPLLTFTAIGYPNGPRAVALLGDLIVCQEHAALHRVADFISNEGWEQIVKAFIDAGKSEPDYSSVRVEYIKEN